MIRYNCPGCRLSILARTIVGIRVKAIIHSLFCARITRRKILSGIQAKYRKYFYAYEDNIIECKTCGHYDGGFDNNYRMVEHFLKWHTMREDEHVTQDKTT